MLKRLVDHAYALVASFAVGMALYVVAEWLSFRLTGHPERRCRMCGCTDARACPGGCWWVGDDFCSSCLFGPEADEPGGGW